MEKVQSRINLDANQDSEKELENDKWRRQIAELEEALTEEDRREEEWVKMV